VKLTVKVCVSPRESTTWIGAEKEAPTGDEASRLALTVMFAVGAGDCDDSEGTEIGDTAPEGFTTPFTAVQPCTSWPELLVNCPSALSLKLPSRVYVTLPAASCITKNPPPWIAASNDPPVL